MTFIKIGKARLKQLVHRAGYDIARSSQSSTMPGALQRVSQQRPIRTVIDVGASDGRWSATAQRYFPEAEFLLIEAQGVPHEGALKRRARNDPRLHYVIAAAGDRPGSIHFDASDPFGGAAAETAFRSSDLVVPMTTVDAEVGRLGLSGPFLMKLDTHGFERQVLEGATHTLRGAAVLVIEAYNFELRPGALRFHELCQYLEGLGFRPVDLVDIMRRPRDQILWQFDLVFVRVDDEVFAVNEYG
jgi:FkbM family methyltransferase